MFSLSKLQKQKLLTVGRKPEVGLLYIPLKLEPLTLIRNLRHGTDVKPLVPCVV